jgi:hypothetical protein
MDARISPKDEAVGSSPTGETNPAEATPGRALLAERTLRRGPNPICGGSSPSEGTKRLLGVKETHGSSKAADTGSNPVGGTKTTASEPLDNDPTRVYTSCVGGRETPAGPLGVYGRIPL